MRKQLDKRNVKRIQAKLLQAKRRLSVFPSTTAAHSQAPATTVQAVSFRVSASADQEAVTMQAPTTPVRTVTETVSGAQVRSTVLSEEFEEMDAI